MLRNSLSSIIKQASLIESEKDRIAFLQKNDSGPLRFLLRVALSPNIKWLLPPDFVPNYKPNKVYPDLQGMLYSRTRLLYMFLDGSGNHIHPAKREKLFVELLEILLPEDAQLLLDIKDKKLPKTINKKLYNKSFTNDKI